MTMPETAMSAAFAKARLKSPRGRLKDMAIGSLGAAGQGTRPGGHDQREAHDRYAAGTRLKEMARMAIKERSPSFGAAMGLFLERVTADPQALAALVGNDVIRQKAAELLNREWNEMHAEQKRAKPAEPAKSSGGHLPHEAQGRHAARSNVERAASAPTRNGGGQVRAEAQRLSAPAATSPERIAAAKVAGAIVAKSMFDSERVNGRAIGDLSYSEMRDSALRSRDTGLRGLREAYVQVRLLKSVAYHEAMDSQPARNWASEDVIRNAKDRFDEFGHMLTHEIDSFLKIEEAR